jgi:hypothetical protein
MGIELLLAKTVNTIGDPAILLSALILRDSLSIVGEDENLPQSN